MCGESRSSKRRVSVVAITALPSWADSTASPWRLPPGGYALNGVIDSTDDPIFSVDKDYRYTSFNTSHATAMRGLFDVQIKLGDSILDCHTVDEDRARAKANIDRALRGEVVREEGFAGDEALSRRWFAMSHSPVPGADGLIVGVVVSVRSSPARSPYRRSRRGNQLLPAPPGGPHH